LQILPVDREIEALQEVAQDGGKFVAARAIVLFQIFFGDILALAISPTRPMMIFFIGL
jgi:hypothetical protein